MKVRIRVQPVGMDDLADRIAKDLGRRIQSALKEIADESEEFVKELISVPVERDSSGLVTRRSAVGEPPRTDTGELLENVGSKVIANGMEYSMVVYSERPSTPRVPLVLENPQGLSRPYMIHLYHWLNQQMPGRLIEEMGT